jgi:hypothetical protein
VVEAQAPEIGMSSNEMNALRERIEQLTAERDDARVKLVLIRLAGDEATADRERNACARIAEDFQRPDIAEAIRARSAPTSDSQ